jgi:hypothetical protein
VSATRSMIKCKFCDWQRVAFQRGKKSGKTLSNYSALLEHVEIAHFAQFKLIQKKLDEIRGD